VVALSLPGAGAVGEVEPENDSPAQAAPNKIDPTLAIARYVLTLPLVFPSRMYALLVRGWLSVDARAVRVGHA
jgi:hypothetical protein